MAEVKEGDRVIISSEHEYIITKIEGDEIRISPVNDYPDRIKYIDGEWKIPQMDVQSFEFVSRSRQIPKITFQDDLSSETSFLSGDPNLDLEILSKIDNEDLFNLCQTNKYIQDYCNQSELWRIKSIQEFGFNPETDNAREARNVYFILSNSVNDPSWSIAHAASESRLKLLEWLLDKYPGIYPNSFRNIILRGDVDVLKLLIDKGLPISQLGYLDHLITPLAERGHLDMLKFLYELSEANPQISFPERIDEYHVIKSIISNGHWDTMKWLIETGRVDVRLLSMAAREIAIEGNIEMLEWILNLDPEIKLNSETAKRVAGAGHLDVLKMLAELEPPVIPARDTLKYYQNVGIAYHPEVIEYLINTYPDRFECGDYDTIRNLLENEHFDTVKLMYQTDHICFEDADNMFYENEFANMVAGAGGLDLLKYLAEQGVFPDHIGALTAKQAKHFDVVDWLAQLDPPIVPKPSIQRWITRR